MPSSRTKTSPCSIGFKVPASTLRYGSAFMAVTEKPRDFRRRDIEETAMPLPIPEITPPETKMYFVRTIYSAPSNQGVWHAVLVLDDSDCGPKKTPLRGALGVVPFDPSTLVRFLSPSLRTQDLRPTNILS